MLMMGFIFKNVQRCTVIPGYFIFNITLITHYYTMCLFSWQAGKALVFPIE